MTNEQLIFKLVAALKQWICPACGGRGSYHHRGWKPSDGGNIFVNEIVKCKKCDGTGRHPVADEAIKLAEGQST